MPACTIHNDIGPPSAVAFVRYFAYAHCDGRLVAGMSGRKLVKYVKLPAWVYEQFGADYSLDVPHEAYGGWKEVSVSLPLERTALVSMHVWQFAPREELPGLYSGHPYIPAADRIVAEVFPPLLSAARTAGMPIIHVVGGHDYYSHLPGYKQTMELAGPEPDAPPGALPDPDGVGAIRELMTNEGYPGAANLADIGRAHDSVRIPDGALPAEGEYIASTTHQFNAVCRKLGVSHLIYMGFNTNWCILMSPCGMVDMQRLGYLCSVIRQATNAVENKESARGEKHKEEALWRTSVGFGLVFDEAPLVTALGKT